MHTIQIIRTDLMKNITFINIEQEHPKIFFHRIASPMLLKYLIISLFPYTKHVCEINKNESNIMYVKSYIPFL